MSPVRSRGSGGNAGGAHALEFYAVGKLLGRGAFGKVSVGVHKLTEELTAMKLCERRRISEVQARRCLMQEVNILKRLNGHCNIVQLYEVIETSAHVVLVMEFAAGGDLLRYVRQRRKLAEDSAQDLFKQLLDGLSHIHFMGVVHRDIKLENLLLDAYGCLKVADFGVAVYVKPPGRQLHEHCGTPSYIAPEILLEAGYDGHPVDAWSSGVVLYAMLCGRVPFKGENLSELKRAILRGRFHVPSHLSDGAASMVRGIIVVDPKKRLTIQDARGHQWLAGVTNRAETVYSARLEPPYLEEPTSRELLSRVAAFGFPQTFTEDSLREGRLNHATATFRLMAQQVLRRKAAAALASHGTPAVAQEPATPIAATEGGGG